MEGGYHKANVLVRLERMGEMQTGMWCRGKSKANEFSILDMTDLVAYVGDVLLAYLAVGVFPT
jgi:hypothetical protein